MLVGIYITRLLLSTWTVLIVIINRSDVIVVVDDVIVRTSSCVCSVPITCIGGGRTVGHGGDGGSGEEVTVFQHLSLATVSHGI